MEQIEDDRIETPDIPPKRSFSTVRNGHESDKEDGRYVKKKKYANPKSGDNEEEAEPSPIDASFQSTSQFSSVADSSVNSADKINEALEIRCMICRKSEETFLLSHMACGHNFHSSCIQTWLKGQNSCPICMPNTSVSNTIFEAKDTRDFPKELTCVICMDTMNLTDFETKSCGHSFHAACSQTWSQIKDICPICMPLISENSTSNTLKGEGIYKFDEENNCLICLNTVEYSDFIFLSCHHSFHFLCIHTWFQIKKICPVCMVEYTLNATEDDALYKFQDGVKCMICMDTEKSSDFQNIECGHSFHTKCKQVIFDGNDLCPVCKKDHEDVRCVICMDTEKSSVFEFISCCHSFHSACIRSWFIQKKSCPICMMPILESNTSDIFENHDENITEHEATDDDEWEDINTSDESEWYTTEGEDENEWEDLNASEEYLFTSGDEDVTEIEEEHLYTSEDEDVNEIEEEHLYTSEDEDVNEIEEEHLYTSGDEDVNEIEEEHLCTSDESDVSRSENIDEQEGLYASDEPDEGTDEDAEESEKGCMNTSCNIC